MSTKVKNETTRANGRGSRKNSKVNEKELTTVINSISVSAPDGSGLSDGSTVCTSSPVGVGSSSGSVGRAARMDARAKLENSVIMESINESSVRDLTAKIVSFFSAPEWSEYQTTLDTLRATFPNWNDEQINAAVRAAAKNSGVDLTAPACSVARVLVVIRNNFLKEFVSLVGMSFAAVRDHIRKNGVNTYSWRLSCGAVLPNSDINDFVLSESLTPDFSPSALVGGLLSLRVVSDYNRRLSAARSDARIDFRNNLANVVRYALQLGLSDGEISAELADMKTYVSTVDTTARKRLENNRASAIATINECNDLILSLGGASLLDVAGTPSKVCKAIKRALRDRSRAYSVVSTCDTLLAL